MGYEVTLHFETWDEAMAAFDAIDNAMPVPGRDAWFLSLSPEPDDWVDAVRALTQLRTQARPARTKR
jgi:hypothetical protein